MPHRYTRSPFKPTYTSHASLLALVSMASGSANDLFWELGRRKLTHPLQMSERTCVATFVDPGRLRRVVRGKETKPRLPAPCPQPPPRRQVNQPHHSHCCRYPRFPQGPPRPGHSSVPQQALPPGSCPRASPRGLPQPPPHPHLCPSPADAPPVPLWRGKERKKKCKVSR